MKILILEDEPAAASRLIRMVKELEPDVEVLEVLDTVSEAIEWFQVHPEPDVIFSDIHLADGSSFCIFEDIQVKSPIIFTTAFDQYAIQGFKLNSVDYLLKPIKKPELNRAIKKLHEFVQVGVPISIDYQVLAQSIQEKGPDWLKRFVIRFSGKIKVIKVESAAYFYLESRVVILRTHEGKNYPVDFNLDQLDKRLDPSAFFRINRKYIVSLAAIKDMFTYSKSRVNVILHPTPDFETITSTDRSGSFKRWLAGETS